MAYGYGLNATILQLAQGYAMLANHGVEMPLSLHKLDQVPEGRQVLDPKIADQVLMMLEQVTLPGGTAKQAVIPVIALAVKQEQHTNFVLTEKVIRTVNIVPCLQVLHL